MAKRKKKGKRKNNYPQNITQKTKDGAAESLLKPGCDLRCSGRVGRSCSTCGTSRSTVIYVWKTFGCLPG